MRKHLICIHIIWQEPAKLDDEVYCLTSQKVKPLRSSSLLPFPSCFSTRFLVLILNYPDQDHSYADPSFSILYMTTGRRRNERTTILAINDPIHHESDDEIDMLRTAEHSGEYRTRNLP